MIIIIILALLTIGCGIWLRKDENITALILTATFGIILFMVLIALPIMRMESNNLILRIESAKETLTIDKSSPKMNNSLMYVNVGQLNEELKITQYWAKNPWTSVFFNQDILKVEPIK